MFHNGQEPWFDPVDVGVGQGIGQGIAGGVGIGLVVVALFIWRDVRVRQLTALKDVSDPATATW